MESVSIASRTWSDIASATKLTSISLSYVQTASQQADVVAALTALHNLEQLTWRRVHCSGKKELSDSLLLQHLTQLTSVELRRVTAAGLQHLGFLTKLQHLSINVAEGWAAAGCPGLQELKALTSLQLNSSDSVDLPPSISQLSITSAGGRHSHTHSTQSAAGAHWPHTVVCVAHDRSVT